MSVESEAMTHLEKTAACELETLRRRASDQNETQTVPIPPGCLHLILSMKGNRQCMDCKSSCCSEWADVSYGILLCVQCAGQHRSYGVRTSVIRSLRLDHFNAAQIMALLEGGNDQLRSFFDRHGMDCMVDKRYKTKAARFYRNNLLQHATDLVRAPWQGRQASRSKTAPKEESCPTKNVEKVPSDMEKEQHQSEPSQQPLRTSCTQQMIQTNNHMLTERTNSGIRTL